MQMWAHCYRINAGINTNMSVESLNNFLKNNQLKRRANVTVEKLLDTIDGLIDIKMWQRILNIERPNANNYQDRTVMKAHKKAETLKRTVAVVEMEEGHYQVKSSKGECMYNICYNELCERECKTLYCRVCKICIHRYRCECNEYAVRNTICKHVHLVRMYEERMGINYVLDSVVIAMEKEQPSEIKKYHEEEISHFIEEKSIDKPNSIDEETTRTAEIEDLTNFMKHLNKEEYTKFLGKINILRKEMNDSSSKSSNSRKRKMEKQEYYPIKKPCT